MYDIITVGSATIDVFVRTKRDTTRFATIRQERDVCYPIGGKVLIEDLAFETGGAGTNTAVAFSRLGLKTAYVGKLGNDLHSQHLRNVLKAEHVTFLGSQGIGHSGYSVIIVGLQHDRTVLTYKGINDLLEKKDVSFQQLKTTWFYFGSMLGKSFDTLCTLAAHARKHYIPYAFNPSTYLARQGFTRLKPLIHGCSILILNKEEAVLLSRKKDVSAILHTLQKHARIVVITDGKNGAHAYDGRKQFFIQPRKVSVVDTTGAGDAFAAGVVFGIASGKTMKESLAIGLAEAESVLQSIGAKNILLTAAHVQQSLRNNPPVIKEP